MLELCSSGVIWLWRCNFIIVIISFLARLFWRYFPRHETHHCQVRSSLPASQPANSDSTAGPGKIQLNEVLFVHTTTLYRQNKASSRGGERSKSFRLSRKKTESARSGKWARTRVVLGMIHTGTNPCPRADPFRSSDQKGNQGVLKWGRGSHAQLNIPSPRAVDNARTIKQNCETPRLLVGEWIVCVCVCRNVSSKSNQFNH